MSINHIKKAQDEIVQDREDKIVEGIKIILNSIKKKEESLVSTKKDISELKKELIDIEEGNYECLNLLDSISWSDNCKRLADAINS